MRQISAEASQDNTTNMTVGEECEAARPHSSSHHPNIQKTPEQMRNSFQKSECFEMSTNSANVMDFYKKRLDDKEGELSKLKEKLCKLQSEVNPKKHVDKENCNPNRFSNESKTTFSQKVSKHKAGL